MEEKKKKITTSKKEASAEVKRQRLEKNYTEWTGLEFSVKHAYLKFKIRQEEKGNSKETLAFYDRFYKKYVLKMFFKHIDRRLGSACGIHAEKGACD